MRDVLHIFRKDVRHLWPGILLVLAMACLEGWINIRYPGAFLSMVGAVWALSATYLGASLVLEEGLPGHQQYWLTRPFCRRKLLMAKLVFLAVFLALPELLLQAAALAVNGVSPLRHVGGLVCTGLLFSMTIGLAVAAVAAVTESLLHFLYVVLALAGLAALAQMFAGTGTWGSLEWIRHLAIAIVVVAAAMSSLFLQYFRRRTQSARAVLGAGVLLVGAAPFVDPWGAAFALQSAVNRRHDASGIRISFEPNAQRAKSYGIGSYTQKLAEEGIAIPIVVTGLPPGSAILGERIAAAIEAPGGKSWHSTWTATGGMAGLNPLEDTRLIRVDGAVWQYFNVPAAFYRAMKDTPVDVHTSLALTLLGEAHSARLPQKLCSQGSVMGRNWLVNCAWPSPGPARAYIRAGSLESLIVGAGSYGPFPTTGSIWHHDAAVFSAASEPRELKLETWRAVAHFGRDLEFRAIRLSDYVVPRITDRTVSPR